MLKTWNAESSAHWRAENGTQVWSRATGLNETGFYQYAQSAENAPGDTFARVGIQLTQKACRQLRAEILDLWTRLRLLHPLLDSHFVHESSDLRLEYVWAGREDRAKDCVSWQTSDESWEAIRNRLTNGPRILTDNQLSRLYVYERNQVASHSTELELVFVTVHAISDGGSITSMMNDLLHLIAHKPNSTLARYNIEASSSFVVSRLPRAMECQMPLRTGTARERWQEAIAYVLYDIKMRRKARSNVVVFGVSDTPSSTCQTIQEFSERETSMLREVCKTKGCTIGHLIYAASTAAYTMICQAPPGREAFIGTPANARRFFHGDYRTRSDDFSLNIMFLDIRLPCIQILGRDAVRDIARLWTLTRLARSIMSTALQDPFLPYYSHILQERRAGLVTLTGSDRDTPRQPLSFGSSSIGDIDSILQTSSLPFRITDFSMGMRTRAGESLMHSYTFQGRLRLSLMHDRNLWSDDVSRRWLKLTAQYMTMTLKNMHGSGIAHL